MEDFGNAGKEEGSDVDSNGKAMVMTTATTAPQFAVGGITSNAVLAAAMRAREEEEDGRRRRRAEEEEEAKRRGRGGGQEDGQ